LILPLGLLVIAKAATVEGLQLRTYDGFGPTASQPLWLQAVEIYLRGGSDRLDPSPLPSAALVALSRSAPQFGKIRGTAALRGHSFRYQLHTEGRYPENFGIHDPMPNGFPGHKWVPFVWKRHKLKADRPIEPIPSDPSPARAN
jgi:hypothetical protein